MAGAKSRQRGHRGVIVSVALSVVLGACSLGDTSADDTSLDDTSSDGLAMATADSDANRTDDGIAAPWWTEIERFDSGTLDESGSGAIADRPGDSLDLEAIDFENETWVATGHDTDRGVEAWADEPTPDSLSAHWFPTPTQFGGPRVFLVEEARGEHLKVSLPIQPNGTSGWIRADAVTLERITVRAEVDLTNHRLTVWDGDEIIVQTDAAIGKPATPTPVGTFFVRDVIPSRPSSAYGSYIIGLSGFSETLTSFNGGLPAIAIHGTNRPDLVGQNVSNGCVRIPNDLVELLAVTVPLGTPVTVVA